MDKYIQQLLTDNTRVIVPGFGAFIRPQGEGELMFNQFLSFDDGMLSNKVKDAEGISSEEATQKINSYVAQVNEQLNEGKTVSIEGVGSFKKEGDQIQFTSDSNAAASNVVATAPVAAPAPETPKAAPVKETPRATATTSVMRDKYGDDDNKKTWIYIIAIVLLFLLGVGICLFVVNKDNFVYNYFYGSNENVDTEIIDEPVEDEDESDVPAVEAAPAPAPAPVAKSQPFEKRYNIIVGSYNDEASAKARVEKLQAKGFNESFVIQRAIQGRQKYLAVIESHESLPTAERRQEEIVDNYRIESWITNAGE
ncbi:MAG: SPOR domain-containing protein [Bacteroidales bacterium]|nr:SPOR domain-containing protein [Bacteroidales bacterium]